MSGHIMCIVKTEFSEDSFANKLRFFFSFSSLDEKNLRN